MALRSFFFTLFLFLFGLFPNISLANDVPVLFFHGEGCPHCAAEKDFLETIEGISITEYEVFKNAENLKKFKEIGQQLNAPTAGVPFTVIGEQYVVGFDSPEGKGQLILSLIENYKEDAPLDTSHTMSVAIPFLGTIDPLTYSLPMLSIVLGTVDGFNPCAMWVLIFLIGLLFGMKDRRRMWILGLTFLGISGLVYFLFLAAWLNFFLFVGYLPIVRIIIGLVAVGGGMYYLYDAYKNKDMVCKVTNSGKRKKIFERIKDVIARKQLIWAIIGIALLAFAVNLVELICSAGLPAIFTSVLALSDLPVWEYYSYLLLYILFYLIDDLFVFFVAMKTLEITNMHTRYIRISHYVGGVLLLILGLLLLFAPGVLMFG